MSQPNETPKKRSWKKIALILISVAILVPVAGGLFMALIIHFANNKNGIMALQSTVGRIHLYGLIAQTSIAIMIVTFWKNIVNWANDKKYLRNDELARAIDYRSRIALFLFLYLVLIPIGPGRIWGLFL